MSVSIVFILILNISWSLSNPKATNYVQPLTTTQCEEYQKECVENCSTTENCTAPEDGKRNHCYVLWEMNANNTPNVHMKGCFLNNEQCFDQERCVSKEHSKMLYCCCEGDYCNKEFFWEPSPTTTTPVAVLETQKPEPSNIILIAIVITTVLLFIICGTTFYVYYYKRNRRSFNEVPSEDPGIFPSDTSYQGLLPVQLVEIKARGRFGAVWKGKNKSDEVAVKIFPAQDKQSWSTEQEIFKLAQMDHSNILHFIAAEKRGSDHMQVEFWLITAYHERGSLCDFLKAHTLTWTELCRVVETMARGLMHLHEELPSKGPHKGKPSVAHRDFKSKNVLLKNDLTACIADFGLALVFESGKSCGDTHGQVGTRRYMAPEVLEGAISFTPDAFLRIDMYACGLVLWELVSRCTAQDAPVAEYRLPFEEEVGQHPTLEDMQESVVQRKVRPVIKNTWRNHNGLSALCDTMEECWDHDAEARLSASCVMERVMLQSKYQNCTLSLRIENEALLGTGKESSM
ncbi:activin receptor type-2A [Onthophagus taurus]|uniref:activin receptor type-2A n=1 Tax=Onthophagus taurus TaxID=166361 RepID=UPI000C1FF314|nr:activin receptor type-2A isoform X2 [Onthophagus taurus]